MKRRTWIRVVLICLFVGALGYILKNQFADFYRGFNTGFNGW